jgi:predicted glutamine amidotransferase
MCIAILNTTNTLTKETLKQCWKSNPDGAGMIYTSKGQIQVFKEMYNFDKFYKEYLKQRKSNKASNFVLHFRIATSGKIDKTNCHPFSVNKNLAFVHNGMININQLNANVSDTYTFNELILKKLPATFLNNHAILDLIESYIAYSKLIFLDNENNASILNEDLGHWDADNNWYSNNSYECRYSKTKVAKAQSYNSYQFDADYYNSPNSLEDTICSNCDWHSATYSTQFCQYLCYECKKIYETSKYSY